MNLKTAQKSQGRQKLYFTAFGGNNYSTAKSIENNFTNFEYNEISRIGDIYQAAKRDII